MVARSTDEVDYPESDGAVSESNKHVWQHKWEDVWGCN